MLDYLPFIIGGVIALLVIVLLISGYVKAPPDMAYLISGHHKKPRILIGKAGIKIPFFERLDKLSLGAIQVDVKTSSSVPTAEYINIKVDSTVSVRVGRTPEMIELAAQNFLNVDRKTIAQKIIDLLEGNVREIIGQMKLTEMVNDRKRFSEKVQENAVPDLARYGLELITFNVQNFVEIA
jgi:flotillin